MERLHLIAGQKYPALLATVLRMHLPQLTSVTGLIQGIYKFELKVTDNSGATARDTMQVTVNPHPNQAPVPNAGLDQTITLPVNTVTLSGSGSDGDGTIVSYVWTKISGPANYTIVNPSSAVTNVTATCTGGLPVSITGYR